MELPVLRMSFADQAALVRELDQNIYRGRAFIQQPSDVPVLSECVLVLIHPDHGDELRLNAQVVMSHKSGPMCGVGLALPGLGESDLARLAAFAKPAANQQVIEEPETVQNPMSELPPEASADRITYDEYRAVTAPPSAAAEHLATAEERLRLMMLVPQTVPVIIMPMADTVRPTEPGETLQPAEPVDPDMDWADLSAPEPGDDPSVTDQTPDADDDATDLKGAADNLDFPRTHEEELHYHERSVQERANSSELQSDNRQQRLRSLNAAQQLKVARTGELADRITVERLYGKQVWDALLHNPRLTVPEVARIARKGTVPKPLLELIMDNAGWVKADGVRRALLSNPKIGTDAVLKLLRITPKAELKVIEKGTVYGSGVREAARKLLKQ